jgi:hypothetical protein
MRKVTRSSKTDLCLLQRYMFMAFPVLLKSITALTIGLSSSQAIARLPLMEVPFVERTQEIDPDRNDEFFSSEADYVEIIEEDGDKTVLIKDKNGNTVQKLQQIDSEVYEIDLETGESVDTGFSVEESEAETSVTDSYEEPVRTGFRAAAPVWGPLLSQTAIIGLSNTLFSSLDRVVTAILLGMPAGIQMSWFVATSIAQACMYIKPNHVKAVTYFREARGCWSYRLFVRTQFYNPSGAVIETANHNCSSFIGVRNSPANPPACRAYGF